MKVWIVEFGDYSSRFVSAVYSTEENAKIAAEGGSGGGEISEFDLDPAISLHRSGFSPFHIEMNKDGEVLKVKNWHYFPHESPEHRIGFRYPLGVRPAVLQLESTLWAKSEEQAIKSAKEHRAQSIASGEWEQKEIEAREFDARMAAVDARLNQSR